MCKSVEEVGTKYGVECAATMAADLVVATTRVQDIRHTNIEVDDLYRIITEAAGG